MDKDYCIKLWNDERILQSRNMQRQAGRKINKVTIDDALWNYTLAEIDKIMKVGQEDYLLDIGANSLMGPQKSTPGSPQLSLL
jgi:hypothetical protein